MNFVCAYTKTSKEADTHKLLRPPGESRRYGVRVWRGRFHDMFGAMIVLNLLHTRATATHNICFTICLFISPDLDGDRFHDRAAPKNGSLTLRDHKFF
jgi:hypothetical protein